MTYMVCDLSQRMMMSCTRVTIEFSYITRRPLDVIVMITTHVACQIVGTEGKFTTDTLKHAMLV